MCCECAFNWTWIENHTRTAIFEFVYNNMYILNSKWIHKKTTPTTRNEEKNKFDTLYRMHYTKHSHFFDFSLFMWILLYNEFSILSISLLFFVILTLGIIFKSRNSRRIVYRTFDPKNCKKYSKHFFQRPNSLSLPCLVFTVSLVDWI